MILITGGTGVLGRALAAELSLQRRDFRLLSSADGDLRDPAVASDLIGRAAPSLLFHLAGRVHGLLGNARHPAEMFTENIRINTNVIDAAYRAGCRKVVAVSTVAIYGNEAVMPVAESAAWQGPPHKSEAAYGHAKRAMLAQLEAYATQHGLDYAYPIMTNIYGPHDRFDEFEGHVVPALVAKFHKAAQDGSAVKVWGSGVAERDFIFSRDAARALVLIADRLSGPVNVATGTTVRIRQLADALSQHSGVSRVEWDATKPDGQLRRSYDVSRLTALGFQVETSLAMGLAETYDWYSQALPNVRR